MKITLSERIVEDEGYRKAYVPAAREGDPQTLAKDEPSRLAGLQVGQRVRPRKVRARQAGTPEFGLIRLLEKRGIGRPATYAGIVDGLVRHRYVERAGHGELRVTQRGRDALEFLLGAYPELFSLDFSARMESWLDAVADGRMEYAEAVQAVWRQVEKSG